MIASAPAGGPAATHPRERQRFGSLKERPRGISAGLARAAMGGSRQSDSEAELRSMRDSDFRPFITCAIAPLRATRIGVCARARAFVRAGGRAGEDDGARDELGPGPRSGPARALCPFPFPAQRRRAPGGRIGGQVPVVAGARLVGGRCRRAVTPTDSGNEAKASGEGGRADGWLGGWNGGQLGREGGAGAAGLTKGGESKIIPRRYSKCTGADRSRCALSIDVPHLGVIRASSPPKHARTVRLGQTPPKSALFAHLRPPSAESEPSGTAHRHVPYA